jgi:hypothetical protein
MFYIFINVVWTLIKTGDEKEETLEEIKVISF